MKHSIAWWFGREQARTDDKEMREFLDKVFDIIITSKNREVLDLEIEVEV